VQFNRDLTCPDDRVFRLLIGGQFLVGVWPVAQTNKLIEVLIFLQLRVGHRLALSYADTRGLWRPCYDRCHYKIDAEGVEEELVHNSDNRTPLHTCLSQTKMERVSGTVLANLHDLGPAPCKSTRSFRRLSYRAQF
jgi:hypothetical protein